MRGPRHVAFCLVTFSLLTFSHSPYSDFNDLPEGDYRCVVVQTYKVRRAGTLAWDGPWWVALSHSIILTRDGEELKVDCQELQKPGSRAVQVGDIVSVVAMRVGRQ